MRTKDNISCNTYWSPAHYRSAILKVESTFAQLMLTILEFPKFTFTRNNIVKTVIHYMNTLILSQHALSTCIVLHRSNDKLPHLKFAWKRN